ncbi:unnamed protein product [Phaeothamnion confervicola]
MAVGARLVVRRADTCEIARGGLQTCSDKIEHVEWASDSDTVLCGVYKGGVVELFCLSRPDWRCCIRGGAAGLTRAMWAPDARHVLAFSDFSLHVSIWSLTTQELLQIRHAKGPNAVAFSPCGRFAAVATRRDCHDCVGVYSAAADWAPQAEFQVDTLDLSALHWSPDGATICVQDCPLEYALHFYRPDGRLLRRYRAYDGALGVKVAAFAPGGTFLAVGSYDQRVRLLAPPAWHVVADFAHEHPRHRPRSSRCRVIAGYTEVPAGGGGCDIGARFGVGGGFRGFNSGNQENDGRAPHADTSLASALDRSMMSLARGKGAAVGKARSGQPSSLTVGASRAHDWGADASCSGFGGGGIGGGGGSGTRYVPSLPATLPSERPDPSQPNPRLGVGLVSWSHDSRFLATRSDASAAALFVWDVDAAGLCSVVLQMAAVRSARWSPTAHRLALCTGSGRVYLWSPGGASWVDVPANDFQVLGLRWLPGGREIVLLGRGRMCIMTLGDDGGGSDGGSDDVAGPGDVGGRVEDGGDGDGSHDSENRVRHLSGGGSGGGVVGAAGGGSDGGVAGNGTSSGRSVNLGAYWG